MRTVALLCLSISFAAAAQEPTWQSLMPVWTPPGQEASAWAAKHERTGGIWTWKEPVAGDTYVSEITGIARPGETGWWQLPGEYWDFDFEIEVRTPQPANGGIMVRSHRLPLMTDTTQSAVYGYQVNIETRAKDATGAILEENRRGKLIAPSQDSQAAVKAQDWNKLAIRARGEVIEVTLNGVTACRLNDEAFIGGAIMMQVAPFEGGGQAEVNYRNARIKDYGRAGQWRSLFDGASLAGWKTWGSEDWRVAEGAIQGRRGPKESEGYLATEESWDDFRVRGQFKMLGDGNYGLFYHSSIRLREDGYPMISGVQGEVMPGLPAQTGRLYESYKRGWLMPQDHKDIGSWALREGDWNTIEIRNAGNHVTTWVNGIRVVDFFDATPQLFRGSFALQLHTGAGAGIDWRGLYVGED